MTDATQKARLAVLSDTARAVYRFVRGYLADNAGAPPTVREIADGVGVGSTSSVSYHLRHIEAVELIVPVRRNGRTYYTVSEMAEAAKGLSK